MKPIASLAHVACASALALAPSWAAAQVDPTRSFYAVAFTHGMPHTGVITAQSTAAPFGVITTAARGTANGALTFDPVRSILYAGACCDANAPLQAYDPVTLARTPTRDLALTSSGSMAFEVDGPRRVLFFYDTVARTLRAVSLAEGNYGAVVATTTLTALPAEPGPTSVGDQMAVDTRAQRLVVTGGDGGPVLTVDVSSVTATVGAFGAVVNTGHVNRSTSNSAGAVAVDEAGRRIFFVPATGTVRVVGADAPFARIADIAVPAMSPNDCGLHFDGRTGNLYVGRGSTTQPVVVAFPSMSVTPFATGPGEVVALSFASPTTACVDRDEDGAPSAACAGPGDRPDCDDGRPDVNPGAAETCDGRDNNCDGFSDEGFCRIDGMCVAHDAPNPANACQRCAAPPGMSAATGWSNRAAMAVCRPTAGPCDRAETCDGTGAPCPADGFEAPTTVCRVTSSIESCDPQERCSGMGAACPSDLVTRAPATEVCNGEDDDCDGMTDEAPCVPTPDAGPDAEPDVPLDADDDGSTGLLPDVPRDQPDDAAEDVVAPDAAAPDAAAPDAAEPPDAMVAEDAAPMLDAAPPPDAMTTPDAAQPTPDAAQPTPDAMVADDAPPANDAAPDAGDGGAQDGGCGCATPGASPRAGGWLLGALAAVALTTRRRRRGSSTPVT